LKRLLAVCLALAGIAVSILPALAAPALTPLDEAGFQKLIDSHKGKVVLYEFWATWCKPCGAEVPKLVKLRAKLKSRGFEVVTISDDETEQEASALKAIRAAGVTGVVYRKQSQDDDHFFNAIDPRWGGALPALFLYDRNGRKSRSFIGETDMGVLESAIRKLL